MLFQVNFGDVFIPPGLDPPRPRVLPEFRRLAHGLRSGNISVLDAKTFYIPNLHYDGAGPDAYFWVGNGSEPNPFGTKVICMLIFIGTNRQTRLNGDFDVHVVFFNLTSVSPYGK